MNLIELERALRQLRLGGMAAVLETRLRQAQAEAMAPIDLISCLVSDELTRRGDRLLERRRKQAAFRDPLKTLDNFDFHFNPKMNRSLVFDLATCAASPSRVGRDASCCREGRTKRGTIDWLLPISVLHSRVAVGAISFVVDSNGSRDGFRASSELAVLADCDCLHSLRGLLFASTLPVQGENEIRSGRGVVGRPEISFLSWLRASIQEPT